MNGTLRQRKESRLVALTPNPAGATNGYQDHIIYTGDKTTNRSPTSKKQLRTHSKGNQAINGAKMGKQIEKLERQIEEQQRDIINKTIAREAKVRARQLDKQYEDEEAQRYALHNESQYFDDPVKKMKNFRKLEQDYAKTIVRNSKSDARF